MSKIYKLLAGASVGLLFAAATVCGQSEAGKNSFSRLPALSTYSMSGGVLGVQLGSELTVETRDAGDEWEITESVAFPGGFVVSDTAFVDKKTLALKRGISREIEKITEYEIKDGKLSGTETDGKKVKKFALDAGAGGEIFNTRAFSFALYARLPLEKDYAARLKIFNPSAKKIEEIDFKVAGEERVLIDGNEFECFRVDVAATEDRKGKYSVWVDKTTRQIIKLSAQTKATGGFMRAAMELQTAPKKRIRL